METECLQMFDFFSLESCHGIVGNGVTCSVFLLNMGGFPIAIKPLNI